MKTLFSVLQAEDGTLQLDWHPDLYPVIDDNGADTDHIIDFAEELLGRLNASDDAA